MRRIRVTAEKILKMLSVMPIAGKNSPKVGGWFQLSIAFVDGADNHKPFSVHGTA